MVDEERNTKTWRAWYHRDPEGVEKDKGINPFAARFSMKLPEWATAVVKFPVGLGCHHIEKLACEATPGGFSFHHLENVKEF